jgi:hypothetical protein
VFLVWRMVLGALRSPLVVALAAALLRIASRRGGARRREALLERFESVLVRSGWPGHARGWINLYASELRWRAARGEGVRTGRPETRPGPARLRVGLFGPFAGLLSFPRELFAACPPVIELVLFDLPYRGAGAGFLAPFCHQYVAVADPELGRGWIEDLASAVSRVGLDLFVNIGYREESYDLIDRLAVPCVANYCTGSDLLHHAGVDFQYHGQPQPDLFVREDRMFCAMTRAPFSRRPVFEISGYYDRRGLDPRAPRPRWAEREPLIVYHGSLHKVGEPAFQQCLFQLLAADSSLDFVMIGKDREDTLGRIMAAAARHGVAARVHHEGQFSAVRGADGAVPPPGWERLLSYLGRARLAPDPWPMPGGSSRFEAYLAGAPSAHMGVRLDRDAWGRRQPVVCDIPSLNVPRATALGVDEYQAIARRCLYEADFADAVAAEQREVAVRLSDDAAWWAQIRALYERWRNGRLRSQP